MIKANVKFDPYTLKTTMDFGGSPKRCLCFEIEANIETLHTIRLAVEKQIRTAAGGGNFDEVIELAKTLQDLKNEIAKYYEKVDETKKEEE